MRELNEIHHFIPIDDEFNDVGGVMAIEAPRNSSLLNINNEKCADSGIVYDAEELKSSSKFSINSQESSQYQRNLMKAKTFNDSGIDSIGKFSSIREFHSKQSLSKSSIKSSSVSTMAEPMREPRASSRGRSKRYSLPDIDKLKQYNDVKCGKKSAQTRKAPQCDMKLETQATIPLVPTEATALANIAKQGDSFSIDPKLINKFDGLSQSLYYLDENGSPKIRERYIKQQRMMIERQEQKRREKEAARREMEEEGSSCSCFNFSRLSKKLKELCK